MEFFTTDRALFQKTYNIEHICSQKDSQLESSELHGIGNLMIIQKDLNSKLQNKPVHEKIEIINAYKDSLTKNCRDFVEFYEGLGNGIEDKALVEERSEALQLQAKDAFSLNEELSAKHKKNSKFK